MDNVIQIARGTRASLDALALAGDLIAGVEYHLTDEGRTAIATSTTTYNVYANTTDTGFEPQVFAPVTTGQMLEADGSLVPEIVMDSLGQIIMTRIV